MGSGGHIHSLSRGIAVLKAINRMGGMTLMEICESCAMPYATTSRIVQTLVAEGLIARDPGRKHYRATGLVRALAQGFEGTGRLSTAARPHIVDLTRRIGWPASITTRIGPNMVVEASSHHHTTMAFSSPDPGYSLPLLECSAGLAYLSSLDETAFRDVAAGLRAMAQQDTRHALDLLIQGDMRQQIRAYGFATRSNVPYTRHPGKTSGIAMPVFDRGQVIGAMTVVYFASAMRTAEAVKRLVPDMRTTVSAIEESLAALA